MTITASKLADAIGRKKLADSLGVGVTAVSNHVVMNSFPASWFFVCSRLATEVGVICPKELFSFKSPKVDTPQIMDAAPQVQGVGK